MNIYIETDERLTMDNWWVQDDHYEILFGNLSESEKIRLAYAVEQVAREMRDIINKDKK